MKIISKELNLISIKDFHRINFFERIKVNSILEKNKCYLSDLGYNYPIYEEKTSFFSNIKTKFITQSKNIFGGYKSKVGYYKKLVIQSGVGFLIRCILDYVQRHLVDF